MPLVAPVNGVTGRSFRRLVTQVTGESEPLLLMRSYEGMLGSIRKGLFLPDATREGHRLESRSLEFGSAGNSSPLTDGGSGPVRAEVPPPEESDSEGKYYQAAALTPEAAAEEFLSSLPGDFEEAPNDFSGHPSEVAPGSSSSSSSESSTSGSEDGPDWSDAFQGETFTCGRKRTPDYSKDEVDHLIGQHVDTLSKLAFVLVPPGRVPEEDAVVALLPSGATQGAVAGLKRLLFEAHTLVVSTLKQRVEKTDDVVPASLDSAERDDRLASQKARLGGLTFQGEEEVAHGACDLVFAMAQKNELVALAFDLVGILSYDVANRYHQALIQRLQEAPPPGYSKVSTAQVLRADRAAFLKIAENITSLRRSGTGVLPLDAQLPTILLDPSVTYHLLPLPAGASSSGQGRDDDKPDRPPKRPHDPRRRPPKKGAKRTNFS
ncbi:unnamed protein product, partial [Symbiodinium necroappetens]